MIVTVADEGKYLLQMTQWMVKSLAVHQPEEKCCVAIVNGSGKYDDRIRNWHPNIFIRHYHLETKKEFEHLYHFCFMALPLYDLLNEFREPLLYMDGDMLVRGSLKPIFDALQKYDYIIRYRPYLEMSGPTTEKLGAKVNAGIVGYSYNEEMLKFTKNFLERIISFVESGKEPIRWNEAKTAITTIDQELSFSLYFERREKIKFFPLEDKYNDSFLKNDSIVWHGKGVVRNFPKYLLESRKYGNRNFSYPEAGLKYLYKNLTTLIRNFLEEPEEDMRVKELADIFEEVNIREAVIVNSDFYFDNKKLLEKIKVKCYDADPVIYFKNREKLEKSGISHEYLIFDTETIERQETDLLMYEQKNGRLVEGIVSGLKIVKDRLT